MTFPSEFTHDGPNDVSKLTKAALVAAFLSANVWAVQVLNHEYWSTIYIQIIECDDATEAPYHNLVFASFYRACMEHLLAESEWPLPTSKSPQSMAEPLSNCPWRCLRIVPD